MRRSRTLVAVLAGLLFTAALTSPAAADSEGEADVDPLIAEMLAEVPGGVLVDSDHAVWPELGMELEVPALSASDRSSSFSTASVGSCATGSVCVFSGYSLGGAKLSWGVCGIHSIPSSFTARSVAHARSSGYTQARNGTTVVATAYVNGWANIYSYVSNVRCVL